MIELYLWDEQGLFVGMREVDETGALPLRSTPTKPMKLTGKQVARWTGEGWEKLAFAPVALDPVEPEPVPATSAQVDIERDRRIDAGFMFQGKLIQSGVGDRENISGSALTAFMAISQGVAGDNLQWDGSGDDFYWITQDNSKLYLGPQGVIDLGLTATNHKAAHIRAGFTLKEMDPRPADHTADRYWPARPVEERVESARVI